MVDSDTTPRPVQPVPSLAPGGIRRGAGYWLRGYRSMIRFDVTSQRTVLPLLLFIQVMMGAGMAIMYGFFLGDDLPPLAGAYVATGIPALSLVPLGFVAVPLAVSQLRMQGSYDYVWSLPVPRTAAAAATFSVYTALALPGTIVALFVAQWRYGISLQVSPMVVPAILLSSLMAASVGFGVAHLIENPQITALISNVMIFFVLLFSPIIVPIERFPGWLAAIHEWLPFHHMAVVIRDGLSDGLVTSPVRSYLILGAWTVGSWLLAGWAISRRR
jgi:ABC-2 type transport system permease protein